MPFTAVQGSVESDCPVLRGRRCLLHALDGAFRKSAAAVKGSDREQHSVISFVKNSRGLLAPNSSDQSMLYSLPGTRALAYVQQPDLLLWAYAVDVFYCAEPNVALQAWLLLLLQYHGH